MKRFSFPKNKRLVNSGQFRSVMASGSRFRNDLLLLYIASNKLDHCRLGVSIGKPCGNAVVRNRIKRILREVFRQSGAYLSPGNDYVVMVPRKTAEKIRSLEKKISFIAFKAAFLDLLANVPGKIEKET